VLLTSVSERARELAEVTLYPDGIRGRRSRGIRCTLSRTSDAGIGGVAMAFFILNCR